MSEVDVIGWRCSDSLGKTADTPEVPSGDAVHRTVAKTLTRSGMDIDSSCINVSKSPPHPTLELANLYMPDSATEEHCKDEVVKANDDDDENSDASSITRPMTTKKKTRGRVKIGFKLIEHKQRRCATFHKRRKGLMKKGSEISTLTGAEVMVLAAWGDKLFSYSTKKMQKVVTARSFQDLVLDSLRSTDDDNENAEECGAKKRSNGYYEHDLSSRSLARRSKEKGQYEQTISHRFPSYRNSISTDSVGYSSDMSPMSPQSPRHKTTVAASSYPGKEPLSGPVMPPMGQRFSWPCVSNANQLHAMAMTHVLPSPQQQSIMAHVGSPPRAAALASYQALHQRMSAGDVNHGESTIGMYHSGNPLYMLGQQMHSNQLGQAAYINPMTGMPMYRHGPYPEKGPSGNVVITPLSRQAGNM